MNFVVKFFLVCLISITERQEHQFFIVELKNQYQWVIYTWKKAFYENELSSDPGEVLTYIIYI